MLSSFTIGIGAVEYFASKGVVKDSMWNARMGSLGVAARIDIPVVGTVIEVVNDRIRVEDPPNGWPISAETGWQEYHDKADKTFAEIVAELAGAIFNKTVFEGSATSQAFEWEICMETKWPRHQRNFRSMWQDGASGQGVGRSRHYISSHEWLAMYRDLPQSQPIVLTRSDSVACLMRGDDTSLLRSAARYAYVWLQSHSEK